MKKSRTKGAKQGAKKKGHWQGKPRKKRQYPWYFRILFVLLPIVILLLLEGALRFEARLTLRLEGGHGAVRWRRSSRRKTI